jgi:hypothetical protein
LAGRTTSEANRNFFEPIRLSVSCLTKSVIVASRPDDNDIRVLSVSEGLPFKIRSSQTYSFHIAMRYKIVEATGARGPFKASIVAYNYTLHQGGHPNTKTKIPHIHLYAGSNVSAELFKKHIPTERISIEEVIRFLIEELGVQAIRTDWDSVLSQNLQAHKTWRTWPRPNALPSSVL